MWLGSVRLGELLSERITFYRCECELGMREGLINSEILLGLGRQSGYGWPRQRESWVPG